MAFGSLSASQRIAVFLSLEGGPEYSARMRENAANTVRFGKSVNGITGPLTVASKRTWLMNQALFTLRRYTFYATLAITSMAVGLVKLGYDYQSSMQQARVALAPVFKNTQALNNELNQLFQLGKLSPFVLSDMTTAFRVMYPALHLAGMGVGQMNSLLMAMVNALSFAGKTSPGALNRVSYAIQHMLNQGRVTGRIVQQLSMLGIPVHNILAGMGVDLKRVQNIASLNISPQSFLAAFIKFTQTNAGFRGAALRQSLQTFHGTLQVIRDSLSQIMGEAGAGIFGNVSKNGKNRSGIQGYIYGLIAPGGLLDTLGKVARKTKSPTAVLFSFSKQTTGGTQFAKMILLVVRDLKLFLTLVGTLISQLGHSKLVWVAIWGALESVRITLTILNVLFQHLHNFLYVLVPLWVLYKLAIIQANLAIKANIFWTGVAEGETRKLSFTQFVARGVIKGLVYGYLLLNNSIQRGIIFSIRFRVAMMLTMLQVRLAMFRAGLAVAALQLKLAFLALKSGEVKNAVYLFRVALVSLARTIYTTFIPASIRAAIAATGLWDALLGPVGWIIAGITLLVGTIVLLYLKWKPFHDLVNKTFSYIRNSWPIIKQGLIMAFSPIQDAINALMWIINKLQHLGSVPGRIVHSVHTSVNLGTPLMRASGGLASGRVLVGELGPEILNLPPGSRITPANQVSKGTLSRAIGTDSNDGKPIIVQVMLDRRVLAEAVARDKQDRAARR